MSTPIHVTYHACHPGGAIRQRYSGIVATCESDSNGGEKWTLPAGVMHGTPQVGDRIVPLGDVVAGYDNRQRTVAAVTSQPDGKGFVLTCTVTPLSA